MGRHRPIQHVVRVGVEEGRVERRALDEMLVDLDTFQRQEMEEQMLRQLQMPVMVQMERPPADRSPDASLVRFFEGKSLEELQRALGGDELIEVIRRQNVLTKETGGNPDRIDAGDEAASVAAVCAGSDQKYTPLLHFRVASWDIDQYWAEQKSAIAQRYGVDTVTHPFAKLYDTLSTRWDESFRGVRAFDQLAKIIPAQLPDVVARRELRVLYPASGAHIAPLLTAMQLIDAGVIDRAVYVYTELTAKALTDLALQLEPFAILSFGPKYVYPDAGWERTMDFHYHGGTIRIQFACRRSGDAFYREEDRRRADLIVLHDTETTNATLLAPMLMADRAAPTDRAQLIVMEGDDAAPTKADDKSGGWVKLPMEPTQIPGPYGHCVQPDTVMREVGSCFYKSAWVFPLNAPALQALAQKAATVDALRQALMPSATGDGAQ